MTRRPLALATALLLLSGTVGCDHATKAAATARLAGGRAVELLPGVLDLRYTENHDTAFSLLRNFAFAGKPLLLGALACLSLAFVCAIWLRARREALHVHVAFALITAGAIGNIVDRAMHGFVVDFIHLRYWPVFNVADVAIVVGAGILILFSARNRLAAVRA